MADGPEYHPFRAIALVVVSLILFDSMAVFVRLLQPAYAPQELSAYRNVLGVIPSFVVLAWMGEFRFTRRALFIRQWKLALFRGLVVATAQFCFFTALGLMELATVSALAQTSAFFVVMFSIVLLGERVGVWRWMAVVIGFSGAIWILRPGAEAFSLTSVLPIAAAACYAISMVTVRMLDRAVPNPLLYIYAATASGGGAIVLALATSGFSPIASWVDMSLILAMAMCGGTAVLLMMLAFRMAMPSLLAPFSFVGLITAFTLGYLVFGEAPFDTLFPGVILIVGAGALVMWRERRAR